jgi:pyroglutamyl-peptidase
MKQTVLITGFAPFGGETINPSWQVAKQLHGWQPMADVEVVAAELACAFNDSTEQLLLLIEKLQPCLVLAVGQAGERTQICLEHVAINLIEARIPDNTGLQPSGVPVVASGPDAYFCQLPLKSMLKALHQANIPATISYTAGTYVCNSVFYQLCHLRQSMDVPAGFIHIPYAPSQTTTSGGASLSLDIAVDALKICIVIALSCQSNDHYQAGTLD